MKIQTYTVVVGNEACDAKCPYCVSKMTGVDENLKKVNWRNFDIGCKFAKSNGVSTVLLTGKGEPTLFPSLVTQYTKRAYEMEFPLIELQTNGRNILSKRMADEKHLEDWYNLGMTTVCVSIAHYNDKRNNEIFQFKDPLDLKAVIARLHDVGFSVRLSCVMLNGYIDTCEHVETLVTFARQNGVEQLTVRPVAAPSESEDIEVQKWTKEHLVSEGAIENINDFFRANATELMQLTHGATVYDYHGQNLCLSNCLTLKPEEKDTIRQLIFFPDGHLRYDWCNKGAILL